MVTDRHATGGRDLLDVVRAALDAGLPAVQLREKDLLGKDLLALAERLRAETASRGATLIVNDRVDVAVAVGADGVQLGGASLPIDAVRPLLADGMTIGASTHSIEEVQTTTADFVVFGPVYDTPSKRAFGPPQGEARLADAVRASPVPVIAIGGIDASHVAACRVAGAAGIAVIRAVLEAPNPAAAVRDLLDVA